MLKARMLGLSGWYSTNILGNRDGEVLDDPDSFKTKEESKLGVLEHILEPERYPELYGDVFHKVRINYYPPRGDNKEGWDNIDIFGWLGYPMQIKVDFLCRDSILAAPLALDLVLFTDLAQRAGLGGIQEWLSFYYKSPQARARPVSRARPVHPADQAQEHAALDDGRGPDHPPRHGLLHRRVAVRVPEHGMDSVRTGDALELDDAWLTELQVAARVDDLAHERRDQDLAAFGLVGDACREHDMLAEQVSVVAEDHLAGVKTDSDVDGIGGIGLRVGLEPALHLAHALHRRAA